MISNLASEARLEQAILESGTAKGRLIHYHSFLEQEVISSVQKNFRKGHKQNVSKNRFCLFSCMILNFFRLNPCHLEILSSLTTVYVKL